MAFSILKTLTRCFSRSFPCWIGAILSGLPGILAHAGASIGPDATDQVHPGRPNIILVLIDDLGWADVGYHGMTDFYETPHIDNMTRHGMVFTDAYAAAANCAPSRACLLSGTYTPRHHVYAVTSTDRGPKDLQRLIPIPNKSGLAPDNVTLADALQSAGYATGIFGKWHLEGEDGAKAGQQGFETVIEPDHKPNARKIRPDDPKAIFSINNAAMDFIEKNAKAGKPFFAFVSHHAIHSSLEARPESIEKFQNKKPGLKHHHVLYAACTYDMDSSIGLLLEKVDSLGIAENTLVLFTSDNGGTQQSSQEPLRGNKGSYYEGGIRAPFIGYWPGTIAAGTSCDIPVINIDLYPTFLAVAGVAIPDAKILDGENLLPLLKQTASRLNRPSIFWHFPGYLDRPVIRPRDPVFRTRPVSVMRSGDWKLHLFHEEMLLDGGIANLAENRCVELYDLRSDPGEFKDLALTETERRDAMLAELQGWFHSTGALIPADANPSYDPESDKPAKGKSKK